MRVSPVAHRLIGTPDLPLSWPKTPSVPPDSCDERESECRRLFVVKKSAREVARTSRYRRPVEVRASR